MIQRVQSIWLLLAAAGSFFTLNFSFYSGLMVKEGATAGTLERVTAQSSTLLLILTVGVGIAAIITIFLYKDRKLQLRICLAAIVISLINILLYYLQTKKFLPDQGNYNLPAIIVFIIPILLIFAARGIYKDQKLVKSLDRLR
jgi:uncharacterized membrane protein